MVGEDQLSAEQASEWLESAETSIDDVYATRTKQVSATPEQRESMLHQFAQEDGLDLGIVRARAKDVPGNPFQQHLEMRGEQLKNIGPQVGGALGELFLNRTQGLPSSKSALPSFDLGFNPARPINTALDATQRFSRDVIGLNVPIPEVSPVGNLRFGTEEAAKVAEYGIPFATSMIALASNMSPGGRAATLLLGGAFGETSAEFLRVINRKSAGLDTPLSKNNPMDEAQRLLAIATAGGILASFDMFGAKGFAGVRRKRLDFEFGLNTQRSLKHQADLDFLGVEAGIGEVADVAITNALAKGFSIYPASGLALSRGAVARQTGVVRGALDLVSRYGDMLTAGLGMSGKSTAWGKANDGYIQFTRRGANDLFDAVTEITEETTRRLGVDAVHINHAAVKPSVTKILAPGENMPIVFGRDDLGRFTAKPSMKMSEEMGKEPFRVLEEVMNFGDKVDILKYIEKRNQIERFATRFKGANDPIGRLFANVGKQMRLGIDKHMVAPPEVKVGWHVARQNFSDMNAFADHVAWKEFRKADSQFGFASKTGATSSQSTQVTLQKAMNDPLLAPDIVDVWFKAAREGQALPQYRNAVETHFQSAFQKATVRVDKPGDVLDGVQVIKWDKVNTLLGRNDPDSTLWEAHKRMITQVGGDPAELEMFLEVAQRTFPLGLPNFNQMAVKRLGLGGLGSLMAFVTVGSRSTASEGAMAAAAMLIGMRGIGDLFFNPKRLKSARRILDKPMSEQTRWKQIWLLARGMGVTRSFTRLLRDNGVEPANLPPNLQPPDPSAPSGVLLQLFPRDEGFQPTTDTALASSPNIATATPGLNIRAQ
jgi:hypothetical protein